MWCGVCRGHAHRRDSTQLTSIPRRCHGLGSLLTGTENQPDPLTKLTASLAAAGLSQRLVCDDASLTLFASDLVNAPRERPVAILRPLSPDEVQQLVMLCRALQLSIEVRGAGLSYSGGYLAQDTCTVVFDTSAMVSIAAHPGSDHVVCVEAGVTWQALDDWLSGAGKRPALSAPISGSHSTIAASIRQGMPGDMSGVCAVEVVTAEGEVLRTGALATDPEFSPLWRGQGPDFTGVFIGDCGALGVLTRAWIRLERIPAERAFFSCALPQVEHFRQILAEVAAPPGAMRAYCFDPSRAKALKAQPWGERLALATRVLAAQRGLGARLRGLYHLLLTALSRGGGDQGTCWAVHFCFESDSREQVYDLLARAARSADRNGWRPLATTVAEGLASRPYSVRGVLGASYERWAPVSAVFDLSRFAGVAGAVVEKLETSCRFAEVPGLHSGFLLLSSGGDHVVLEPMLLWPSSLYPLHQSLVPRANVHDYPDAAQRDSVVTALRAELATTLDKLGGQHVQIGRFYDYVGRVSGGQLHLLKALKREVDADERLARGTLGLRL